MTPFLTENIRFYALLDKIWALFSNSLAHSEHIGSLDVAKNHQIQNFGSKFEFSEAIFFQNGNQLLVFSN